MKPNIDTHLTRQEEQDNGFLGKYRIFDGRYFNETYFLINKFKKKIVEFGVSGFYEPNRLVDLDQFIGRLEAEGFGPASIYRHDTTYNNKRERYSIDWYLFLMGERVIINIDHDLIASLDEVRFRPESAIAVEDVDSATLMRVFEIARECTVETKDERIRYISIVSAVGEGTLRLTKHKIRQPHVPDLELYYGEGFAEKHRRMMSLFNQDERSGLFIFHGLTGSGKTNYIRYLIGQSKPETDFIFYPVSLLRDITSPQLISFISDYQNAVLIIEESEDTVQSRDSFNADKLSMANLLNVSDGLLSDVLNLKIICTFNTDIKNLDRALLREGRLLGIHKFDALPPENANKIAEQSGIARTFEEPATLAQIFNTPLNQDLSDFVAEDGQIGFR